MNCEYSKDHVKGGGGGGGGGCGGGGGGGGGCVLRLILLVMCRWPLSTPNQMLVIFGRICNFAIPA